MQRVAIVGPSGAGKSTLARQLAPILNLPVIHLDAEHWQPGWSEPPRQWWQQRMHALARGERWIIDGNFGGTMEQRFAFADTVIFMDFPRWRCLSRIVKRVVQHHGKTRPDMAPDCPERWDWSFMRYVWNFPRAHRPGVVRRVKEFPRAKFILRTPRAVKAFLAELRAAQRDRQNLSQDVLIPSHDAV